MNKKIFAGLLLCMLICVNAEPLNQIIAMKTDKSVYDVAGLLAPNESAYLEKTLDNYNAQTGNAIVIVTVNDMGGDYLEHYSVNLAQTWGIGQEKTDNGLLILAAMKERKLRIEVGYGLEEKITDSFSSQVMRGSLEPNFKTKQYFAAFNESVASIITKLDDNSTPTAVVPVVPINIDSLWIWIFGAIIIAVLIALFSGSTRSRYPSYSSSIDDGYYDEKPTKKGKRGKKSSSNSGFVKGAVAGALVGSALSRRRRSSSDDDDDDSRSSGSGYYGGGSSSSDSDSGGGGSSFGGYGGGGFGGGGASGGF